MEGGDGKAIQPMLRRCRSIRPASASTPSGLDASPAPGPRMGVSLKKSRADDGNRIPVAFSPNPSYSPRGQPERHRQAASVRRRLLRSLPAAHDSNTTMG